MRIIDIKPRSTGLSEIITDSGQFVVNTETLAKSGITAGMQIEEKELNALDFQSECDRAKSRALWYLSKSDHSRKALYDKLCRAFSPSAADAACIRMEELGLIDDAQYARRVAATLAEANCSRNEIMRKLFVKGVSRDLAKEALEELSPDASVQLAQLIELKYARRLTDEAGVKKVYSALIRKGFSYGDVKSALREYSQNLENSEEL